MGVASDDAKVSVCSLASILAASWAGMGFIAVCDSCFINMMEIWMSEGPGSQLRSSCMSALWHPASPSWQTGGMGPPNWWNGNPQTGKSVDSLNAFWSHKHKDAITQLVCIKKRFTYCFLGWQQIKQKPLVLGRWLSRQSTCHTSVRSWVDHQDTHKNAEHGGACL